jgi:hypothetical protein
MLQSDPDAMRTLSSGVQLGQVYAISPNGRYVVGEAYNSLRKSEGFLIDPALLIKCQPEQPRAGISPFELARRDVSGEPPGGKYPPLSSPIRQVETLRLGRILPERPAVEWPGFLFREQKPMAITKEEILELFRETDRRLQELAQKSRETDRLLDRLVEENTRQSRETDRKMRETDRKMRETDRKINDVTQSIGRLGNRLGQFVEEMVKPAVVRLFRERGIEVHQVSRGFEASRGGEAIEVDLLVVNTTDAVLVEVKSELKADDMRDHLERLERFKRLSPQHAGYRVMGAVAAMVVPDETARYAYRQGLFVLGQSGDTMTLRNDGQFEPKVW